MSETIWKRTQAIVERRPFNDIADALPVDQGKSPRCRCPRQVELHGKVTKLKFEVASKDALAGRRTWVVGRPPCFENLPVPSARQTLSHGERRGARSRGAL